MFGRPPHPLTRLRWVPGLVCRIAGGRADLQIGATHMTLEDAVALRLLETLRNGAVGEGDDSGSDEAATRLLAAGVLEVEFLRAPGGPVAARLRSTGYAQPVREGEPPAGWRLHRHGHLRPDPEGWRLGQPLSRYELQLADAGLLELLREASAAQGDELALRLAQACWAGGLIEDPGTAPGAAAVWSHEDLVFHAASRRHADHRPRGRRAQRPDAAPARPPLVPSAGLEERLRQRLAAASFESVLAGRRSVRGPLPAPTREELRDLLLGVQAERGSHTAPCRAYPMAGGAQSIDLYLVTASPDPGEATLERFDAASGDLVPLAAPPGSAQRLLDEAAQGWGDVHGVPAALVVVTARVAELAARYEATAYRLALLEAGCAALLLTQVATALGLGSCLLGNGDSALFALAAGLPEWDAPAIAEVAIAGRLEPAQR